MPSDRFFRSFLTLLLAAGLVAACGGDEAAEGGATDEAAEPLVDPAEAATISGVISFEGTPPENQPIDMGAEPNCAEKHDGQPRAQTVLASDGNLQNVFVYVKEGLPERSWPAAGEAKTLDQEGCMYEPHVMGIQTGQTLEIMNSDGLLHNINARPSNQRGFNISQPTTMTSTRTFAQPEIMIPVECDVHGWMRAYIGVLEHPYYAVSGEDGSFTIENLPPGDYVIEAWHEEYGTKTANVSVQAQEEGTADFTYNASETTARVPLGQPLDPHDHHDTREPAAPAAGR